MAIWTRHPSPHPACELPLFSANGVQINGCRRGGRVAHPTLDEIRGNVVTRSTDAEAMAKPFGRAHWPRNPGSEHCCLDNAPRRDAMTPPKAAFGVGLKCAQHVDRHLRHGNDPKYWPAAFERFDRERQPLSINVMDGKGERLRDAAARIDQHKTKRSHRRREAVRGTQETRSFIAGQVFSAPVCVMDLPAAPICTPRHSELPEDATKSSIGLQPLPAFTGHTMLLK
jgi:hypothetical protein